MPKHKRDKHTQSIIKGQHSEQQPGVPPVGTGQPANTGDGHAFQQHDQDNRLGDYEGTGNHARTGNRGQQ